MARITPPRSILVVLDNRGPASRTTNPQFAFGLSRDSATGLSDTVIYPGDIEFVIRRTKELPKIYPGLAGIVVFRNAPAAKQLVDARLKNIPVLLFGSASYAVSGPTPHWIASDEDEIVRRAMEHLYEKGHRRIGILARSGQAQKRRTVGWKQWLEARGLPFDPAMVFPVPAVNPMDAFKDRTNLKNFLSKVTAVFSTCDYDVPPFYKAVQALGRSIPGDVSVVSVDNLEYVQYLTPALSSVDLSLTEAGSRCFQAMHELWRGERMFIQEMAETRLVVRDSVARLAAPSKKKSAKGT